MSAVAPFGSPLRVLHVWQPAEAGVPRYAWAAAQYQSERGWDVHVACPRPTPHGSVTTHEWDAVRSPVRGVASESRALNRLLERIEPDVAVLHSAKAGLVGRLVLRGRIPTVYIPHAWPHLALPKRARPAAIAWERVAARWTETIVAVGQGEADEARRAGIDAPVAVVANPVPPGWERATAADRTAARDALGLGPEPIAVCAARLSRQKGQDVLLDAWPAVRARVPNARLLLLGDGPDRAELESRAVPGAEFVGAVSDPRPYLAAADLSVLPSRWEGLSLSMLEAMAAGRSQVVTAVAGSEVIRLADAGDVVAVEAPEPLARSIAVRLSGDVDTAAEGDRAARYVAAHHTFAGCMAGLGEVIREAAARPR